MNSFSNEASSLLGGGLVPSAAARSAAHGLLTPHGRPGQWRLLSARAGDMCTGAQPLRLGSSALRHQGLL